LGVDGPFLVRRKWDVDGFTSIVNVTSALWLP